MSAKNHFSVLIVGAGLAGLACALTLEENGIDDFILIEAQNRVGGRCKSIRIDEKWIELGAKSFEGEVSNNPVYRLAAESKLIDSEETLLDRDECYHDEDAESIDEDVIDEIRQIYDEILEKKIPTYPYENYPDISLGDFISAEFEEYFQMKKPRLDQNDIDERRRVIHWLNKKHPFFSSIPSNNLNEVSVQGWNSLERLSRNGENSEEEIGIEIGFENFVERSLFDRIPSKRIVLNKIVKKISLNESEQKVDVEIVDRSSGESLNLRVEHVVSTISLGCLKQTMHQLFVPPLPHSKRMSIQRLPFGTIDRPFWDVDFEAFHFLWDTEHLDEDFDLKSLAETSFQSHWCKSVRGFTVDSRLSNVLVTEISGEAAKYVETIPDDLLSASFEELLCHFYPDNPSPSAEKIIRSRWFNEPFVCGSHTFIKLGSSIHDIKQLASPIPNKPEKPLVLFAGEATHERFYGTAHGAFLTGIREAKRIIEFQQSRNS